MKTVRPFVKYSFPAPT